MCLIVAPLGQPNVGKSSLLNALFGTHKVKASRTPGKVHQCIHHACLRLTVSCRRNTSRHYFGHHRFDLLIVQVLLCPTTCAWSSKYVLYKRPRPFSDKPWVQVLCGILPISQIPSIPACIHYASRLLPLEQILRLTHPSNHTDDLPDKRTWRGERSLSQHTGPAGSRPWTAMDILTAYADSKGWVTAKAGRPDTNRAGNARA
jgi:50S ribosome-binding GTPase